MGKHDIEIRRTKVKRLIAQGAGPTEMARRLDVSRQTIYRDIEAIEDEIEEMKGGDIDDFLLELKSNFETVNNELWTLAHSTEHENVKLGAFKQIVKANSEMVDVLQKVGVLDKVAEQLELTGAEGEAAIAFVVNEYRDDEPDE